MKKTILFLLFPFIIIDVSADNLFPFKEVNNKWNIGLMGAYAGYGKEITSGAFGISLTIKGVHANFMGLYPSHKDDVRVGEWSDKTCTLLHIGYQIPITRKVRIIPIIGYSKIAYGTTNGWDWEVDGSGNIDNNYLEKKSISGFDYGGIVVFNWKKLIINVALTKYTMFGGIGLEF
jgi:hypothetical protein